MLGFADELWWSRLAQPNLHSWSSPEGGLRLAEKTLAQEDPDPKALACYGLLLRSTPTTLEAAALKYRPEPLLSPWFT